MDVEHDFQPYYVVSSDRKGTIRDMKAALKDASEVLLATDPDREGESISWHLLELLKPKVPVRRIVFHEITEEAVLDAIEHSREIDRNLVDAQESRRILDRLFGYKVSPVLWKWIAPKLSAGRVQSVAVRLVVEREEERKAFRKAGFWNLEATLSGEGREFTATLVRVDGKRVAIGKDFDAATGKLGNADVDGARRGGCGGAGGHVAGRDPLGGHGGGGEARDAAPVPAVHHLDAAAGGQPEARVLRRPDDVGGAETVRFRRDLLSPDRLDDPVGQGAAGIGSHDPGNVRGRVLRRCAPVPDEGQERAGSARGDPADGFLPGPRQDRKPLSWGRSQGVRPDLEADGGVPDDRREAAAHDRRDHGGRRGRRPVRLYRFRQGHPVPGIPPRLRGGERRSRGRPGGPGDIASGMQEGRPCVPAGRRCGVVVAGPLAEIARDDPPAPVHRRVARQAAGGRRHRAAVHLRVDHQDHPGSRIRVAAGEGARPDVYGLRPHGVPEGDISGRWSSWTSRGASRRISTSFPTATWSALRSCGSSISGTGRTGSG